jgi:regulator of protease activity HflC (stomatin/prohibitin superfamily)
LLFDPRNGGLQRAILAPGRHYTGVYGRLEDFDVTFSTRQEKVVTTSAEGLSMTLEVAVIYRPVLADLYELDTEIGPNYYDEVIGPEFRSAARGVFARHSYLELQRNDEGIEDQIEADLRRRTAGKHVEIASVTIEGISYSPEISQAIQTKLVREQEAIRQKAALESEALEAKMKAEAALEAKQRELALAEKQAAIDRVRSQAEAQTKLTRAEAEAQELTLLAKARAEEQHALSPLAVAMHAYDALAKLGGSGTTILLGDFSHLPSFLFPTTGVFRSLAEAGAAPAKAEAVH